MNKKMLYNINREIDSIRDNIPNKQIFIEHIKDRLEISLHNSNIATDVAINSLTHTNPIRILKELKKSGRN